MGAAVKGRVAACASGAVRTAALAKAVLFNQFLLDEEISWSGIVDSCIGQRVFKKRKPSNLIKDGNNNQFAGYFAVPGELFFIMDFVSGH